MAQRQFRSDDTSKWNEAFGKGTDGAPFSNGTFGGGNGGWHGVCSGTAGQSTCNVDGWWTGSFICIIHQSAGSGAGNWELNFINSMTGGTAQLKYPLINSYGSGAQIVLVKQSSGGTISGTVNAPAWNGSVGGIIAYFCKDNLTISGNINVNSLGYRGASLQNGAKASGKQGEGYPNYNQSVSPGANGNGAGGGTMVDGQGTSGGGGGSNGGSGEAGHTNNVTSGQPGSTVGNAGLTTIFFGGGGGSGSGGNSSGEYGGAGGIGSGIIFIFAKNFIISGSVSLTGGNGSAGGGESAGGSGAGGSCLIKCQTATLGTNKITASGGARISDNHYGGAGGVGRIRCDYFTSVSGSTTPTLSSAQDNTLNVAGGSGFFNFF